MNDRGKTARVTPIRIILSGACGRMGTALLEALFSGQTDIALGAALEKKGHALINQKIGLPGHRSDIYIVDEPKQAVLHGDVIVDFTHPLATLALLKEAKKAGKPMVIGTTGLSMPAQAALRRAARVLPIVISPNMSIGVNVLFKLIADATAALGGGYDVEIVEMHHRYKKDAPSGTALRMGEMVARARGTTLSHVGRLTRQGMIGERSAGEIGICALRGGDVIGQHRVIFAGSGEQIELAHHASNRSHFAQGALAAARWIVQQKPGLYTLMDVLGLCPTAAHPP